MQQRLRLLILFKSAQHVSGDKFAHPQEHFFDCIYSFCYNAPPLLPTGATVEMELHGVPSQPVHCTKSCIYTKKK